MFLGARWIYMIIGGFDMFGNKNQMAQMMKKVQKMQEDMAKMQEELKLRTVETTAGGGAIKVVANGDKQLVSLVIDPGAVDPEDVEMLQDMILAAANEALRKADDMTQKEMGKLTSGMGLPPGMM